MSLDTIMGKIFNRLADRNPVSNTYHYWMLTMRGHADNSTSKRIIRTGAGDREQEDMAQKVVDGTYGLYVGGEIHQRTGQFMLMFSRTEDDDAEIYSAGYHYEPHQYSIAAEQIIQYLDDGKMPSAPQ